MSREVLGSSLDDPDEVDPGEPDRAEGRAGGRPGPRRPALPLEPKIAPVATTGGPHRVRRRALGSVWSALVTSRDRAAERLDVVRGSRQRTTTALLVVAAVGGLIAVGVTEQVRQAGRDRAASVVAWLDPDDSDVDVRGQAVLRLNVVNTGDDRVVVTSADLEGGLEDLPSGVALELGDDLVVQPRAHASGTVRATVARCTGPIARGGPRDGDLRVTLWGADLRDTVLDGARVGAFPVTSATVVDLACGASVDPVVVVGTVVRADGLLYVALRGALEDVQVGFRAPDGVRAVTEPASPVLVPGGPDAPMTTVAVDLEIDTCTLSAQQLNAGQQVQLAVDGERYATLDYTVVNAWVAREVARSCD